MTDTDSILRRIQTELAPRGRKTKISKLTGILPANLALVSKPDWNPTASTMRTLERAIANLSPDQPDTSHPQD